MNKKEIIISEINILKVRKENLNEQEKKELKRLEQNLRMIIKRESPEYRKKENEANINRQRIRIQKNRLELQELSEILAKVLKQK